MGQPKFTNKQHDGFLESQKENIHIEKKHECHIKRNIHKPTIFNRLNIIKDKIRSENSRKALVDFSIFGRRRQKLFSEERREILNFSKISLVVVSVYSR